MHSKATQKMMHFIYQLVRNELNFPENNKQLKEK